MKNISLILLLVTLTLRCVTPATVEEKQGAWDAYLDEEFEIIDTVIHYDLTQTSLTLKFDKTPMFHQWLLEVGISDTSNETIFHFPQIGKKHLDTVQFNNGKLILTGFDLGDIPPDSCDVWLYLAPIIPGKQLWSDPLLSIPFVMNDREDKRTLTPWPKFYETNFITFNNNLFDTLPEELQEFCSAKKAEFISKQSLFFRNSKAPEFPDSLNFHIDSLATSLE